MEKIEHIAFGVTEILANGTNPILEFYFLTPLDNLLGIGKKLTQATPIYSAPVHSVVAESMGWSTAVIAKTVTLHLSSKDGELRIILRDAVSTSVRFAVAKVPMKVFSKLGKETVVYSGSSKVVFF